MSLVCSVNLSLGFSYEMNFGLCRWYQMKISAMWEEGGNKTLASPARVVQYEGARLYGH
jgi:hypothetical protein